MDENNSLAVAKLLADLFELVLLDENHPQHDGLLAELKKRGWEVEQTVSGHLT